MKTITLNATSPFELSVNKAEGARLWRDFMARGSQHSGRASLLPYLIRRCEREKIPYTLVAVPGMGYWIEPTGKKKQK